MYSADNPIIQNVLTLIYKIKHGNYLIVIMWTLKVDWYKYNYLYSVYVYVTVQVYCICTGTRISATHFLLPTLLTMCNANRKLLSCFRLFTFVNKQKLSTASYGLFTNLLDNYDPRTGVPESLTPQKSAEIDWFLNNAVASQVMRTVENVLVQAGKIYYCIYKYQPLTFKPHF